MTVASGLSSGAGVTVASGLSSGAGVVVASGLSSGAGTEGSASGSCGRTDIIDAVCCTGSGSAVLSPFRRTIAKEWEAPAATLTILSPCSAKLSIKPTPRGSQTVWLVESLTPVPVWLCALLPQLQALVSPVSTPLFVAAVMASAWPELSTSLPTLAPHPEIASTLSKVVGSVSPYAMASWIILA